MHRVRMLKHFGVTPYLVFDGDFLPSKAHTEAARAKRREDSRKAGLELLKAGKPSQAHLELQKAIDVTPEMARHLIEELKRADVPYVVAPYEADSQLVYLERHGYINGIISEDSDLLVFGAKRLLTKMDQHGQCIEINRRDFCAVREISLTGWTDDQFRQMTIFSGCDYLEGISNMGLKTAYRMMRKYKSPERVIRMLQFDGKFRVSENYLAQYKQAELTFLYQRVFCPKKKDIVLLTEPPASSPLSIEEMPYIGARIDRELARAIASGDVNPISKLPIIIAPPSVKSRTTSEKTKTSAATATKAQQARPSLGKPIDAYFKDNGRIAMAEMDRNCFSLDAERVAALTQNGLMPRVFPLPRPYIDGNSRPPAARQHASIQRRRTEPVSQTLSDLDPSLNLSSNRRRTAGPIRRISVTEGRPLKKARLCEDEEANETPDHLSQKSRFFPLEQSDTHPQTSNTAALSDDSIDEALASLPDISGEWGAPRASRGHQELQIFQDGTSPGPAASTAEADKTDGEDFVRGSPVESPMVPCHVEDTFTTEANATEKTLSKELLHGLIKDISCTPDLPKTAKQTRMVHGLPTPASSTQSSESGPHGRSPADTAILTPLQRIGAQALQRGKASHSSFLKAKPSAGISRRRQSLKDAMDSLPLNPAFVPLPKVDLAEVEALNKPGGSEDQIIPDGDEENDPPLGLVEKPHYSSSRLDLSRFVYG